MILNTTKLVQYVVYIKFMASGSQVFKKYEVVILQPQDIYLEPKAIVDT